MFADVLAGGGVVRGINAGARELPRSELDALTELAKQHGAKGLVWAFVRDGEQAWRSPIAKFLTPAEIAAINARLEASPGDLLLLVADEATTARAGAQRVAARAGAAFRPDRPDSSRHPVGGRVPGVLVERRRRALGLRRTIRSRRRPGTSMTRRRAARVPTTWSSTAPRSAAARSASTGASCRSRCSSCSESGRGGPGAVRVPARCARATARLRMAGSRWESTGSSRHWPGGSRSAM